MSAYPRNSSFIDLRSKIRTPVLKTRQILNELESMRRTPNSTMGSPNQSLSSPSPRSLQPTLRTFSNPPRTSLSDTPYASPSLLANSERPRIRPALKTVNNPPTGLNTSLSTPLNTTLNTSLSIPLNTSLSTPKLPSSQPDRQFASVLRPSNKRKIDEGYKSNVFSADIEEPQNKKQIQELEKIQSLFNKEIIKNFFLDDAQDGGEFKFDAPEVRGPRKRVAEEPLPDAPSIKISKPSSVLEKKSTETKVPPVPQFSLLPSEPSKPKWACPTCMVRNEDDKNECPCCQTPKPSSKPKWECPTCMVHNEDEKTECPCCQTPKPGSSSSSKVPEAPKPAFKPTNFQASNDAFALFGTSTKAPEAPTSTFKPSTFQVPADTTNLFGTSKTTETNGPKPPEPPKPTPTFPSFSATSTASYFVWHFKDHRNKWTESTGSAEAKFDFLITPDSTTNLFGTSKPAETNGQKSSDSIPLFGIKPAESTEPKAPEAPKQTPAFPSFSATSTLFGAPKPAETNGSKPPEAPKPNLTFPSFSTTPTASSLFGAPKPAETNGSKPPEATATFKFGATPTVSATLPAPSALPTNNTALPATNSSSAAFNFGANTTLGSNPFSFTSATPATNNSSLSFLALLLRQQVHRLNQLRLLLAGSNSQPSSLPTPAAPSFVPLNSGIPSFGSTTPSTNMFSASSTAGGAMGMGRRKLTAKRKTRT
ncbi:hypothetical protein M3Y97_01098900 [Aphelenchoides bicaudatus]|nr:hypothetical protein M3Y97_01098900 [Aphelenchoides bicaudatus]